MNQVDVVLLTKDSAHKLSNCLTSIYKNVPVKNLIVIDGFSTDGTLKILESTVLGLKHGPKAYGTLPQNGFFLSIATSSFARTGIKKRKQI
ncbi:MAG: hypothetical protein ABSF65_10390 [Candidatus Bathyarchaeia archaeon]